MYLQTFMLLKELDQFVACIVEFSFKKKTGRVFTIGGLHKAEYIYCFGMFRNWPINTKHEFSK